MPQKKIVDTVLPTTMVGSYPRPRWFHQQLRPPHPAVTDAVFQDDLLARLADSTGVPLP